MPRRRGADVKHRFTNAERASSAMRASDEAPGLPHRPDGADLKHHQAVHPVTRHLWDFRRQHPGSSR